MFQLKTIKRRIEAGVEGRKLVPKLVIAKINAFPILVLEFRIYKTFHAYLVPTLTLFLPHFMTPAANRFWSFNELILKVLLSEILQYSMKTLKIVTYEIKISQIHETKRWTKRFLELSKHSLKI